jgi:hypothetical protein
MITAVDTSVLIAIAKGEAAAHRWTDLLAAARAEGDLVICDVGARRYASTATDALRRVPSVKAENLSVDSRWSIGAAASAQSARLSWQTASSQNLQGHLIFASPAPIITAETDFAGIMVPLGNTSMPILPGCTN